MQEEKSVQQRRARSVERRRHTQNEDRQLEKARRPLTKTITFARDVKATLMMMMRNYHRKLGLGVMREAAGGGSTIGVRDSWMRLI